MNNKSENMQQAGAENRPAIESNESPAQQLPQSKSKRFLMGLLRWTLIIAIIFGLGFLTALTQFYIPMRNSVKQYQTLVEEANEQIERLNTKVGESQEISNKFQDSQSRLNTNNTLILILKARVDVFNALFTLNNQDVQQAKTYLSSIGLKLTQLETLVENDKMKSLADMQKRLDLIANEIDTDPYAAASDLDVLSAGLQQLEDAYSTLP